MAPATGRSLMNVLKSERTGQVDPTRDHVILGRERNDVGRPNDEGYPVRSIVKGGLIYSHNFESDRWPTGNPETGYRDCDSSPTKTTIIHAHRQNPADPFWALCFGKRGSDELFDLKNDPDCVQNLSGKAEYSALKAALSKQLMAELKTQQDPRVLGKGQEIEAHPYANADRDFYSRFIKNGLGPAPKKGHGISIDDFDPPPPEIKQKAE